MIFIVHENHKKAFDNDIILAIKSIQKLEILILLHSVLLNEINNTYQDLHHLFLYVSSHGITSYYLNQLDLVKGSSHFYVSPKIGKMSHAKITDPSMDTPSLITS